MDIERIISTAETCFAELRRMFPDELSERRGGVLAIRVTTLQGSRTTLVPLGKLSPDNERIYGRHAQDKTTRIARLGQISAWEDRDVNQSMYGGGIALPEGAIAFSGLPDAYDEAFVLWVCQSLALITAEQADAVVNISQNPHYSVVLARS